MKLLLALGLLTLSLSASAADQSPDSRTIGDKAEKTDKRIEDLDKEEATLLQRHQPFYFAYGRPLTKVQLSFKVPVVKDVPLYFAYSQLMFWALEENSKPFRDLTYNPELFYRYSLTDGAYILKSVDIGFWNHNSNGKRDVDSRSYNKSYLRFNLAHSFSHWIFRASIQASALYDFDPTNRDIQDYISPLSFSFSVAQLFDTTWVDKTELTLQASPGGKFANQWGHGGYQASLSFRLGHINLVPAFYLQYYTGYAESLLNYNQREQEFRAGVIF
jgi:phospholipase A1